MQDTILKIENVSKFYPGVKALNNVSFELKKVKFEHWLGKMEQENLL